MLERAERIAGWVTVRVAAVVLVVGVGLWAYCKAADWAEEEARS